MIGVQSLFLELLPLIVPVFVFAIAVVLLRAQAHIRTSATWKWIVLGIFFLGLTLLSGTRFCRQYDNHRFLAELSAKKIESIAVADTNITDRSSIADIVDSLNRRQWFSSDHGGWADSVDLIITLKNGDVHRYWIGYYLKQHGVVVEFYRGNKESFWADGYAFSSTLPKALTNAGVKLPQQP